MPTQTILEIKQKAVYIRAFKLKTFSKVLLTKRSRDGVHRAYIGDVQQIRKPNRTTVIVMIKVLEYWEDSIPKPFKVKSVAFLCNKNIDIWLISDVAVDDYQKKIADARKAYAQARNMMKTARVSEDEHFILLGLSSSISLEEFSKEKRKIMMKYHPDRFHASGLSQIEFEIKSKKYLEALYFVENFLTRKYNRVKLN